MSFFNRPADNRPRTKAAADRRRGSRPPADFAPAFRELLTTRAQYEALRISDGSFFERAVLLDRLHELRSDMAQVRRSRA